MRVILLADVKNVGKKGETKEVSDGYGRNYLIKNRLAVMETERSREILERQNAQAKAQEEEKRREALAFQEKLSKVKVVVPAKMGKDGRMFGSISTAKIAEALQKQHGIIVDKRKFIDNHSLTACGLYDLKVELYKGVIGTVRVEVKGD